LQKGEEVKYLILFALSISLCSCGYQKPIVILPADESLAECTISPPPELTGRDGKDKLILASAWSVQTNNLGKCNQKLQRLQVWKRINQQRFGEGK
jgi:hypothetical protein